MLLFLLSFSLALWVNGFIFLDYVSAISVIILVNIVMRYIFIFKDKDGTERLNNLPQVTGLVRNEKDVFWSLFSEAVLLTPILHAPQHGVYGPTLAADC